MVMGNQKSGLEQTEGGGRHLAPPKEPKHPAKVRNGELRLIDSPESRFSEQLVVGQVLRRPGGELKGEGRLPGGKERRRLVRELTAAS